jgi:hypothetical protein
MHLSRTPSQAIFTRLISSTASRIGKAFRPLIANTKKVKSASPQENLSLHTAPTTGLSGASARSRRETLASAPAIKRSAVQPRPRPDPALARPRSVPGYPHVKPASLYATELMRLRQESAGKNEKDVYEQLMGKFRLVHPRREAPKGS